MPEKEKITALIRRLRTFEGSEEEEDRLLAELERQVADPNVSDYIYWSDLSPEEIVEKISAYRVITL